MTGFQWIEKGVNLVVGKPIAWIVYGAWLAAKCFVDWISRGYGWLRRKWETRRTVIAR